VSAQPYDRALLDELELPSELLLLKQRGKANASERGRVEAAMSGRPELAALAGRPTGRGRLVRRRASLAAAAALFIALFALARAGSQDPVDEAFADGDFTTANALLGLGDWKPSGGVLRDSQAPRLAIVAPAGLELRSPGEISWVGGVGPFELTVETPDGSGRTWTAQDSPASCDQDQFEPGREYRLVLVDTATGARTRRVFRVASESDRARIAPLLERFDSGLTPRVRHFARASTFARERAFGAAGCELVALREVLSPSGRENLARFLDDQGLPGLSVLLRAGK